MRPDLIKMIASTFEACSATDLSDGAKELVVSALEEYPDAALEKALTRCVKEVRGRLSPALIIDRIDDGRPGPEEAWAMVDHMYGNESASVVWTDDMAACFFLVCNSSSKITARMAFMEKYRKSVASSKAEGRPIKWKTSLGTDPDERERVVREAVTKNRLTAGRAHELIPGLPPLSTDEKTLLFEGKSDDLSPEETKALCRVVLKKVTYNPEPEPLTPCHGLVEVIKVEKPNEH